MSTKQSLKTKANKGKTVIIRPSKLDVKGTIALGTYEGAKPNKFNAEKNDYFIRGADDTLYIINETTSLKSQLSQLTAEDNAEVEVVYNGRLTTKSGKSMHDFEVFVINE